MFQLKQNIHHWSILMFLAFLFAVGVSHAEPMTNSKVTLNQFINGADYFAVYQEDKGSHSLEFYITRTDKTGYCKLGQTRKRRYGLRRYESVQAWEVVLDKLFRKGRYGKALDQLDKHGAVDIEIATNSNGNSYYYGAAEVLMHSHVYGYEVKTSVRVVKDKDFQKFNKHWRKNIRRVPKDAGFLEYRDIGEDCNSAYLHTSKARTGITYGDDFFIRDYSRAYLKPRTRDYIDYGEISTRTAQWSTSQVPVAYSIVKKPESRAGYDYSAVTIIRSADAKRMCLVDARELSALMYHYIDVFYPSNIELFAKDIADRAFQVMEVGSADVAIPVYENLFTGSFKNDLSTFAYRNYGREHWRDKELINEIRRKELDSDHESIKTSEFVKKGRLEWSAIINTAAYDGKCIGVRDLVSLQSFMQNEYGYVWLEEQGWVTKLEHLQGQNKQLEDKLSEQEKAYAELLQKLQEAEKNMQAEQDKLDKLKSKLGSSHSSVRRQQEIATGWKELYFDLRAQQKRTKVAKEPQDKPEPKEETPKPESFDVAEMTGYVDDSFWSGAWSDFKAVFDLDMEFIEDDARGKKQPLTLNRRCQATFDNTKLGNYIDRRSFRTVEAGKTYYFDGAPTVGENGKSSFTLKLRSEQTAPGLINGFDIMDLELPYLIVIECNVARSDLENLNIEDYLSEQDYFEIILP